MILFCSFCGIKNSSNNNFCVDCGKVISTKSNQVETGIDNDFIINDLSKQGFILDIKKINIDIDIDFILWKTGTFVYDVNFFICLPNLDIDILKNNIFYKYNKINNKFLDINKNIKWNKKTYVFSFFVISRKIDRIITSKHLKGFTFEPEKRGGDLYIIDILTPKIFAGNLIAKMGCNRIKNTLLKKNLLCIK